MVPPTLKVMVLPGVAFARMIAARSDPVRRRWYW